MSDDQLSATFRDYYFRETSRRFDELQEAVNEIKEMQVLLAKQDAVFKAKLLGISLGASTVISCTFYILEMLFKK